ncbi:MAG: hypothetical protein V4677_16075 [Bacteroidota bacterium]
MPRKRPRILYIEDNDRGAEDRAMTRLAGIIVGSIIANLFLFFNVTFHTMLPSTMVICIFPVSMVISYSILKIKKTSGAGIKTFCILPLCINLVFLVNYLVSFNPKTETYTFQRYVQAVQNTGRGFGHNSVSRGLSTELLLQDYAYEDYYGIKFFLMPESIIPTYKITFTFKTGIFGIRVMTDRHFDMPE